MRITGVPIWRDVKVTRVAENLKRATTNDMIDRVIIKGTNYEMKGYVDEKFLKKRQILFIQFPFLSNLLMKAAVVLVIILFLVTNTVPTNGFAFCTTCTSKKWSSIPKRWVLLKNQSTIDIFSNNYLLH